MDRRYVVKKALQYLGSYNELVAGGQGNFSFRDGAVVMITPSRMPWAEMSYLDCLPLPVESAGIHNRTGDRSLVPSSEWRLHDWFHRKFPRLESVVHTHPIYATALSFHDLSIPLPEWADSSSRLRITYNTFEPGQPIPSHFADLGDGPLHCLLLKGHGLVLASEKHSVLDLIHLSAEIERVAKLEYLRRMLI